MCLLFIPQSQAGCLEPPVHVPLGSTLKFQGCTPSPVQRVELAADIHSYHRDLCAVTSIVCKSLQGATHRACRVHWLIGSLQAGCPEGFMDRPLGRVCKPVKRTVSRLWDPQAAGEFPSSVSAPSCSLLPPDGVAMVILVPTPPCSAWGRMEVISWGSSHRDEEARCSLGSHVHPWGKPQA